MREIEKLEPDLQCMMCDLRDPLSSGVSGDGVLWVTCQTDWLAVFQVTVCIKAYHLAYHYDRRAREHFLGGGPKCKIYPSFNAYICVSQVCYTVSGVRKSSVIQWVVSVSQVLYSEWCP